MINLKILVQLPIVVTQSWPLPTSSKRSNNGTSAMPIHLLHMPAPGRLANHYSPKAVLSDDVEPKVWSDQMNNQPSLKSVLLSELTTDWPVRQPSNTFISSKAFISVRQGSPNYGPHAALEKKCAARDRILNCNDQVFRSMYLQIICFENLVIIIMRNLAEFLFVGH